MGYNCTGSKCMLPANPDAPAVLSGNEMILLGNTSGMGSNRLTADAATVKSEANDDSTAAKSKKITAGLATRK